MDGTSTRGGYSTHIVLPESFALHLPANLPMDAAAPLLCAGITTYSPLRYFGLVREACKGATRCRVAHSRLPLPPRTSRA